MLYAGLDDTQAAVKIARRNINNLSYGDDTTLMAESEEKLKSLLMKVKGVKNLAYNSIFKKMKMMASSPITSWQIDGETMETVSGFIFGGLPNHCSGDCNHET